ncbi:MAG: response regulator transcription factor [Fimbriimonadales bacterium]|nr:response regulator transcription factor [Fimbriimonadales bacterium]
MSLSAEAKSGHSLPDSETPVRVLLVEDDPVLCETLQYNLQRERLEVLVAHNAEDALQLFHRYPPHLVILDVMLPSRSGFDLCRIIRQHSQTPVLFLTARAAEEDKIRGFELGADDYLVKPFSVAELIARIRSILRRVQPTPPPRIRFGEVEIDLEARRVYRRGTEVPMTPKEYALLVLLATHPGKVFTRDQLLDHVWGLGTYVSPRTVDVHIRWLRSKVEPDPQNPRFIQTVRGSGYRFEA